MISYSYLLFLLHCTDQLHALDLIGDNDGFLKVNRNGHEICVNAKYFPNTGAPDNSVGNDTQYLQRLFEASDKKIPFVATGNEVVRAYGSIGCKGKTLSFPVNHQESRCEYC